MKLKTFLLTVLLLLGTLTIKAQEKQLQSETTIKNSITRENLYEQIINYGIKFPDVVFAQAVLESGQFTSKLFKSANNLFGMRIPKKRESSANGQTKSGYSSYEDWAFSVYDYSLWQNYMLKNKNDLTKKEYLALLGKVYAQDKRYVSSLKRVIEQHKDILTN
jgi:uncharacterized FlgJ-related protein